MIRIGIYQMVLGSIFLALTIFIFLFTYFWYAWGFSILLSVYMLASGYRNIRVGRMLQQNRGRIVQTRNGRSAFTTVAWVDVTEVSRREQPHGPHVVVEDHAAPLPGYNEATTNPIYDQGKNTNDGFTSTSNYGTNFNSAFTYGEPSGDNLPKYEDIDLSK